MSTRPFHFALALALPVALPACGDDTTALPDQLTIDSPLFYPEGVVIADDGTFYVGSFVTGAIVQASPTGVIAPFVSAGALATGAVGLRIAGTQLWACGAGFAQSDQSAIYAIDRANGAVTRRIALPGGGFCNDLDVGLDGSLYVTDSFGGRVLRLAAGGNVLETWASDSGWMPGAAFPLSLNGIAVRDATAVYVGRSDTGQMIRIPIRSDGSAGAFTVVYDGGPSAGIDGLRWAGPHRLLAVTGRAALSRLDEGAPDAWSATVVTTELDEPATVALDRAGDAWITEARFGALFDGDDATHAPPPFHVVRRSIPQ